MKFEVSLLSKKYSVRKLDLNDVDEVYDLCSKNTMYYEYCPPSITVEGVKEDMTALPPGKNYEDKFFMGYYEDKTLVAIMDLIVGYPNDSTIYIGLFMTNVLLQGRGIGSDIIQELCDYCKEQGYERIELAWVKGNPQAESFWKKNSFLPIGERSSNAAEHVIAAERKLIPSNILPSAFIWDLDGTLLDSYEIIVSSLYKTYQAFNIQLDKKKILDEVITYSVSSFISKMEKETGIAFDTMKEIYSEISDKEKLDIKSIKNAKEILEYIKEQNIPNYVFTHRGASTEVVLKNTGLYKFFDEIITGKDGFDRKPSPSAINYLIEKYKLDKNNTFYVGDRTIDIECANNADIKSILYLPENSVATATGKETYVVKDLLEIKQCM